MAGSALVDYAVEHALTFLVSGAAPHSCLCLPFGMMDTPESWFNATEYKDIKLKLTGEAGAGAVKVATQQLRV